MSNVFYVYVDRTADEGIPFYVGKGVQRRLLNEKRNQKHANVVKHHGSIRDIAVVTLDESMAFNAEIELIARLHTYVKDPQAHGSASNLTPGGEGSKGYTWTAEQKKHWSDPEFRKRHSEAVSKASREAWKDPDLRKRQSQKQKLAKKKNWQDPAYRELQARVQEETWSDPGRRARHSRLMNERWKDPVLRERHRKACQKARENRRCGLCHEKGHDRRHCKLVQ